MLTRRIRSQIEWHFYNYPADMRTYNEKVRDITESGMSMNYDRAGSAGNLPGSPTERKAILLEALNQEKSWATVVRNTFIRFEFEPEGKLMEELYINGRNAKELICDGVWETTFYRWRDNWLEYALKKAKKLRLL